MTEIPMLLDMLPAFSPLLALWHSAGAGSDASILWMQQAMCAAAAVLVALAIDRLWGEPSVWLHPVVLMGKLLDCVGTKIAPSQKSALHCRSFVLGSLLWIALTAIFFIAYAIVQWSLYRLN